MPHQIPTALVLVPIAHLLLLAIPLVVTDLREKRLPNKWVVPNLALAFVAVVVSAFFGEWQRALVAIGIAMAVLIGGLLLSLRGGLGMGDVKLATALSLPLSWFSPAYTAIVIGGTIISLMVVAIALLITRRITEQTKVAVGPYLLSLFAVVGTHLIVTYL